jgi:hypothetical protein
MDGEHVEFVGAKLDHALGMRTSISVLRKKPISILASCQKTIRRF